MSLNNPGYPDYSGEQWQSSESAGDGQQSPTPWGQPSYNAGSDSQNQNWQAGQPDPFGGQNQNWQAGQPDPFGGQNQNWQAGQPDPFGTQHPGYTQSDPNQQWQYQSSEPYPGSGQLSREDDRTFAILAHVAILVGMVISVGWLSFVGPLIVWAIYKDRSPYVRQAAARSFNFSLGMTIASIVGWILLFTVILAPVSLVIWIVVLIFEIYYPIKAALAAARYEAADYPFQIPVLK
ncbi:DUF4870 domain-containing protein [Changpingibacter yushuensis]|uniref:DUF4870 domain-containing protein n=1 Tax=Changpingibacter yushuensis TaxID=2758440 RepID=UPI00165D8E9E|nr:DUF4870 domain-containing protein [Changpingibacter yushuensis]